MASITTNSNRRQKEKTRHEATIQTAEIERLREEELLAQELPDDYLDLTNEQGEKLSISFLFLHFLLAYPITGYKAAQSILFVGLLATQEFLVKGFTYLSPLFVAYMNIHLGAVFLATKFIQGPLEEREAIAATYGRITYLLLRTKEFEWIRENISNQPHGSEAEVGSHSNHSSSIIQWCIVIVFLAVPRGLILIMFGLVLALFFNPVSCRGDFCFGLEDSLGEVSIPEKLYSLIAQYFTISTQVECITALIAYCTGMTLLLYLSRYTRVGGQTLQELFLLLFGGFGLLAIKPFVGVMMAVLSLCLTNSEFYKAIILGEKRSKDEEVEKKPTVVEDLKEEPKPDKKQEIKNRINKGKAGTPKNNGLTADLDDILVEFLPFRVPDAAPGESLQPTGQGGISWNAVMAIVLAVYFPYYDNSLSSKMRLPSQRYEFATAIVTVAHPLVRLK
jgi:hypothetical protein